jgi:hypothetical protein
VGSGFRVQGSGFRVHGSGFRVQGAGFRVQGAGFRDQGAGCRVQSSESECAPRFHGDAAHGFDWLRRRTWFALEDSFEVATFAREWQLYPDLIRASSSSTSSSLSSLELSVS